MVFDPINLRGDVRSTLELFMAECLTPGEKVYDIGCGAKPFQDFLHGKGCECVGVDIEDGFYDSGHIDLVGSAYHVPIPDSTADAAISCQVLEHLERPLDALDEAARILREGGLLFLSFPFMYPMHAIPFDYGRYTKYFMEPALKERGFEILKSKEIGGFWYCTGMFFGLYLKNMDRGIIKRMKIAGGMAFLVKSLFRALHKLEGWSVRRAGKNEEIIRGPWTVNYVLVARKRRQ